MTRAGNLGALLLALFVALGGAPTNAQDADAQAITAREAFVRGTTFAKRGQWRDALDAFEASVRIRQHPVTTYNIGFCERALARLTRARDRFEAALAEHEAGSHGALPPELLSSARVYLEEAEQRLARVVVTLNPPEAAVSIDGRPVAPVRSGGAMPMMVAGVLEPGRPQRPHASRFLLLIDPGPHVFVVARAGASEAVIERTFAAGSRGSLTLRAHEPRAPRAPISMVQARGAPQRPYRTPGYVAVGIGGASLTSAGVLGIIFLANKSALEAACIDGLCPNDRGDQIDITNDTGTAALVILGVGTAALGAGVFLVTLEDGSIEHARVEPSLRLRADGFRMEF